MSSAVSERHRASRSGRCVVAAGLIAAMAALTAMTLATGSAAGAVLVLDVLLACTAAWLIHSVVMETRRLAGEDRAQVAFRAAEQARTRSVEHVAFAEALGQQLALARKDAASAREIAKVAHESASTWAARSRELEARLIELETELAQARDALWISEAAEKRARAELVIAEQKPRHLRPA